MRLIIPSSALPAATQFPRLSQVPFDGARQMFIQAIEMEAATWIKQREHLLDDQGHRQVVRNGHAAPRTLVTPMGPMAVTMPRVQRCWVHKTANLLDKMPKHIQPQVKDKLHQVWIADTRKEAEKAFELFIATYEAKHEGAVECLKKDRDVLLTFYDFPSQHWTHVRTTNPIESTFATVRLRHDKTKGNGTRKASLGMVFKLVSAAQKRWQKLNGHTLLTDVITGVRFIDGEKHKAA